MEPSSKPASPRKQEKRKNQKRGGRNKIAKRIVFELGNPSKPKVGTSDVMNRNKNRKNQKNRKDQRKYTSPNIFKQPLPKKKRNMAHVEKRSIALFDDTQSSHSNANSVQDSYLQSMKSIPNSPTANLQAFNSEYYSEQGLSEASQTPREEQKEKRLFDFDNYSEKGPRYSCKSVQNTGCNNSPFKKTDKNRKRINSKVKPFHPNPAKQRRNNYSEGNFDDGLWQPSQDIAGALNFDNLMENG